MMHVAASAEQTHTQTEYCNPAAHVCQGLNIITMSMVQDAHREEGYKNGTVGMLVYHDQNYLVS